MFKSKAILILSIFLPLLIVTACSSDDAMVDAQLDSPTGSISQEAIAIPTADPLQSIDTAAPLAVISTRSLRVRDQPSDDAKVIAALKQHQSYVVLALSADGKYVQLEIPDVPAGKGWVDSNFVTIQGDITNIERGVTANGAAKIAVPTATPLTSVTSITSAEGVTATVKTNGQRLRVRKEPTADSAVNGRVDNGDTVTIVEQSTDGTWAKIAGGGKDNPAGGWVATEFLKFPKQ